MKQLLGLIALIGALISLPVPANADEGWRITSFDSRLTIQADGHVQIKETIDVDFGTLEKHGIFRDIPYEYRDDKGNTIDTDITDLSVTNGSDSLPYSLSNTDTTLRIKIGNADRTISGVQHYVISYTETGVLRSFGSFDELYWNTTGNEWPVPIDAATATVLLPGGVLATQSSCYQGLLGSIEQCNKVDLTHFATTKNLTEGEGLTIAVDYPPNTIPILIGTGNVPGKLVIGQAYVLQAFGALLVTLFLGIGMLISKWWKNGRDEASGPAHRQTVIAEYEPPADLRPAEVGVLMDERADSADLSATIIDFATRGFLTVKEIPKSGLFGKRDYELAKTSKSATGLQSYESSLLTALFATGTPVKVSALRSTSFATALQAVKKELYQDLTDKKLFSENPETARNRYVAIGIGLIVVGVIGLTTGVAIFSSLVLGLTIGLFINGLACLIASRAMPKRSAEGTEALRQAKGYKLFLTTVEKDRVPFFEKEGNFMKVMPYAMVFGVATLFAKRLNDLGAQPPQPTWYYGVHPFVPVVFASDMNDFSNSLNSAFAPVSSSSGSGGGGFSGGGFGGGGGGSW